MAKPGRNDPCPCGSGKKYKRCCLDKDEAAGRAALAAALPSRPPPRELSDVAAEIADRLAAAAAADADADELFNLSNAAVDLVHEGKLDEAEQAARCSNACPMHTTAGIASAWSTRQEAIPARQPTATAKSSPSFALTPTTTIPASRTSSTTSSPDSIRPPQADRRARAS
jgi:SEC-C motif